jgi:predicted DNA-binding protein (UPF0251 family)
MTEAVPAWEYVVTKHDRNVTSAASSLGVSRSTLHRAMNSGYVIHGKLYTSKRKTV